VVSWLVCSGKEAFQMARMRLLWPPAPRAWTPQNFSYTVNHHTMLHKGISHWHHFPSSFLSRKGGTWMLITLNR
jgi:hypothetical protein